MTLSITSYRRSFGSSCLLGMLLLGLAQGTRAQTDASSASAGALKGIEQTLQMSPASRLKPAAPSDPLEFESNESIDHLLEVAVDHPDYRQAVQAYWRRQIGQSIRPDQLRDFKGWLYDFSRRRGYLSYAQTEIHPSPGGSILKVRIAEPRLQAVRLTARSEETMRVYGALVVQRLQHDFKSGLPLDTLGLDQRLVSASEDLPVDLHATIRAAGPDAVDLIVEMRDVIHKPWRSRSGLVQLNNHGLSQFGRAQALASIVVEGPRPRASWNLVGLRSEGITYGRAEYEAASYGTARSWSFWMAGSNSRNILGGSASTLGRSGEAGLGISQIDGGWRDHVYRGRLMLSTRQSSSTLALTGQEITRVHDTQLRFRISADNERTVEASSRAELTVAFGEYSRLDGITSVNTGPYAKVEWGLKRQQPLDLHRQWMGSIRLRGQFSSQRLDSFNQMVLGGPTGVRAYSTMDGLGDQGGLVSLEVNHRLTRSHSAGLFYDGGLIRLMNPQTTEPRTPYSLQALGMQINGQALGGVYNVTVAKGIGSHRGWNAYNTESSPHNWRLYGAINWVIP